MILSKVGVGGDVGDGDVICMMMLLVMVICDDNYDNDV